MNTSLKEDLKAPLDKVQRGWIRKPTTILLTPMVFVSCIMFGIIKAVFETLYYTYTFFIECWRGVK